MWPVKAIVSILKNPLSILKNAVKKGKEAIVSLNSKASSPLRAVMSKRETIIDKLAIMDKPKDFIAKIKDTFTMISTLAETGLIPTHLIQKFIESHF